MENRFNIDFFEFCFLTEACIPPVPIARGYFWKQVIDKHYYVLTDDERNQLYDWMNRNPSFQDSLEKKNEDCLLFNARFDPDNQYSVVTEKYGKTSKHEAFLWRNEYHTSESTFITGEYIKEVVKKTEEK